MLRVNADELLPARTTPCEAARLGEIADFLEEVHPFVDRVITRHGTDTLCRSKEQILAALAR